MGKCPSEACARKGSPEDIDTHCCGVTETEALNVTCPYIEYEMETVTKCGCTECAASRAKQIITVRGQVYLVGYNDQGNETLTKPGKKITFTVGTKEHTAIAGGSFAFHMEPTGMNVALKFPAKDNYMSQVVSIDLLDDVDQYTVTVKLPPKPTPVVIDSTLESSIKSSWENHDSVYEIVIPPHSFVDSKGDIVSEEIDVYVEFMDPTDDNSLALAPGEFSFQDDEGLERSLVTYGLINMAATTKSGEEVQQSGDLVLEIDADSLGLTQEDIADTYLWQADLDSGGWINPSPLIPSTRLTRKANQLQSVIHSGLPIVNIDRQHWADECYVMVRVRGHRNVKSIDGQMFDIHTKASGDCICRVQTTETSNAEGLICGLVECGNDFEIVSQSTGLEPNNHHLPDDFLFSITDDHHVLGRAPSDENITDDKGPVHRGETCQEIDKVPTNKKYHYFQFQEISPSGIGSISEFNDKRSCLVRTYFMVTIIRQSVLLYVSVARFFV